MTSRRALLLTLVALASIRANAAEEQREQPLTMAIIATDFRRAARDRLQETLSGHQVERFKRVATAFYDPGYTWPAIIQLWVAGERDFVNLLWWRKDDTETRTLVVALEWCAEAVPPKGTKPWSDGVTNFEKMSEKYAPVERTMRTREIDFVREHRRALAKQLYFILSAKHVGFASHYEWSVEPKGKQK